jgi:hypothetical protein
MNIDEIAVKNNELIYFYLSLCNFLYLVYFIYERNDKLQQKWKYYFNKHKYDLNQNKN